jgi:FkbM family methyltransferase
MSLMNSDPAIARTLKLPPVTNADRCSYVEALDIEPELKRRILITSGCHDCDYISKVPDAGEVFANGDLRYQLMHNGVKVVEDCYCGKWMTELIRLLRGHHEPQEEKVFHEVLKYLPQGATMLELGSFWGYYSLWFQQAIPNAKSYLIEPDPNNLAVGKRNFQINSAEGRFFQYSVGREPLAARPFLCESDGLEHPVAETSVDHFVASEGLDRIELLLSDIQGAELSMLEGALKSIQDGRIRFLFLSTHHHSISQDPLTHQRCLEWLNNHGAHIIAAHNVTESYSGDGLIVASFDNQDRAIAKIEISMNYPTNSLFRELEYDLDEVKQELIALRRSSYQPRVLTLLRKFKRRIKSLVSPSPDGLDL